MGKNMNMKNLKVVAEQSMSRDFFDIYLDISGRREYLMSHRKNGEVFNLLKNGTTMESLKRNARRKVSDVSLDGRWYSSKQVNPRLKCRKNYARKLENSIDHILDVANEYLLEMCPAAA